MQRGLTLIELIVVLMVAAILTWAAGPFYGNLMAGVRVASATDEIHDLLNLARMEAVKRGGGMMLCLSNGNSQCQAASSNWSGEWLLIQDENGNGTVDAGERILRRRPASDVGLQITLSRSLAAINFNGLGRMGGLGAFSVRVAPPVGSAGPVRRICISSAGRIAVKEVDAC